MAATAKRRGLAHPPPRKLIVPPCTPIPVYQRFLLHLRLPHLNQASAPPPPLWLLAAPVRKIILQMHTPARTSQCWSRQTQHGFGVCIWMHLVNGTGNSPSPGQPTLE